MSITITELEMSLDASNKSNAQLQNTCKVQNEKIMQLTPEDAVVRSIWNLCDSHEDAKNFTEYYKLIENGLQPLKIY